MGGNDSSVDLALNAILGSDQPADQVAEKALGRPLTDDEKAKLATKIDDLLATMSANAGRLATAKVKIQGGKVQPANPGGEATAEDGGGKIMQPEDGKVQPDGSKILPDGSKILPDGSKVQPGGGPGSGGSKP